MIGQRQPPYTAPHADLVKRARGLQIATFLFGLGAGLSVADLLAAPVVVGFGLVGLGLVVLLMLCCAGQARLRNHATGSRRRRPGSGWRSLSCSSGASYCVQSCGHNARPQR